MAVFVSARRGAVATIASAMLLSAGSGVASAQSVDMSGSLGGGGCVGIEPATLLPLRGEVRAEEQPAPGRARFSVTVLGSFGPMTATYTLDWTNVATGATGTHTATEQSTTGGVYSRVEADTGAGDVRWNLRDVSTSSAGAGSSILGGLSVPMTSCSGTVHVD